MTEQRPARSYPAIAMLVVGWALLALWLAVYVWRGELNADEGWYLYASRLVYEGQQPYRDFAFTQVPLLPYLYGIPQALVGRGILLGRLTSAALTALGVLAMASSAKARGGARAAAWTVLLAASFTFGLYYCAIVKTYALVVACLGLTIWLLSSRLPEEIALPGAVVFAMAAGAARLSAAPVFVPIALYAFLGAKRWRTRALVLGVIGVAALVGYALLSFWGSAAIDNVYTYHVSRWGSKTLAERLQNVIFVRLPSVLDPYGILALAAAALAGWWCVQRVSEGKLSWRSAGPWLAYGVALALFAVAHALGGGWHREYLVPAALGSVPILGVLGARVTARRAPERSLGLALLCGAVILMTIAHWDDHRAMAGDPTSLAGIEPVTALVREHAAPDEPVLTLEALWTAVEADRHTLPGLSMSTFSLLNTSREEAERRQSVTAEMVVEMIARQDAPVVVLTELDWENLGKRGQTGATEKALESGYDMVYTQEEFGQREAPVWVYVRR